MVLGTLDYMAPEQIRGQAIGPFTDVYSLGCMIMHLLTGEVPFQADSEEGKLWAHVSEPPPRPSARVPGLCEAFDPIVARAMGKRPDARYASAGEVGAAMLAAARPVATRAGSRPRPAPPPPAPVPVAPAPARREILVAALGDRFNVVLLAGLLVVGAILGTIASWSRSRWSSTPRAWCAATATPRRQHGLQPGARTEGSGVVEGRHPTSTRQLRPS